MEKRTTLDKIELFALYYADLSRQFNEETYGRVFFFSDVVSVRIQKFHAWLYETYSVKLTPVNEDNKKNYFFAVGEKRDRVTFDNAELEDKFFVEAAHARLLHQLKE